MNQILYVTLLTSLGLMALVSICSLVIQIKLLHKYFKLKKKTEEGGRQ